MGNHAYTEAQLQEAVDAVAEHGSQNKAAAALGIPRPTVQARCDAAKARGIASIRQRKSDTAPPVGFEKDGNDNRQYISSVSHDVRTVEDALAKAAIDESIWEVERFLINSWEVFAGENRQPLWQVKVWVRRKVPKSIEDSACALAKRIAKHSPKYPKLKRQRIVDRHLLEVSLFDAHLAKYCWGDETGQDYDIGIAESLFMRAVEDIVRKTRGFPIERILFPLGNDFFHVDNRIGTTTAGTPQDFDSRYQKMYTTGCIACVKAIELLASVADVHCIWVPGNHDKTASMHLALWLEAWFRHSKNITFDNSAKERKYVIYGDECKTLLGFTHGDGSKRYRDGLPLTMAGECSEWSSASHREIHLGHLHKSEETRYLQGDTVGPVRVRILPSLSGTDKWHYLQGYIHHYRAAEAYLWSAATGYVGHFSSNA